MSGDNVVPFTRNRNTTHASSRGTRHARDADELLRNLRATKRLEKPDQAILVDNLGRLLVQFYPDGPKAIARDLLEDNEREKRKRYIRIPGERVGPATRHAASGGSFARIIERLIDLRVSENVSRDQAKGEIVRKTLWRTSFSPPPPFRMPANPNEADVAQFAADMRVMCDRLADETELAEFFALIAKHPIFPSGPWLNCNDKLELYPEHEPNILYDWDDDNEGDLLPLSIPWWAPRCIVGHLYIPFTCFCVQIPERSASKIFAQEGKPSRWDESYYHRIESFIREEHLVEKRLFHRLPLWLAVLPLRNRLIPCLYAAIDLPGGFYPNQQYAALNDILNPQFVANFGTDVSNDAILIPESDDDPQDTFYVLASQTEIIATGTRVDGNIVNFKCERGCAAWTDDLPEWLAEQPVARLLRLAADSDLAMSFALAPRMFYGREGESGDKAIFRPAFSDSDTAYTGLRDNTIAAYLLRDFVKAGESSIFEALKRDALIKRDAANSILRERISSFRKTFEQRFES
ncbi:MAG: hypothetical protein KGZ73_09185 [Rhizobiales bacterium]|nr:hypothetical protein [Hyphomicrobiales bacterium]